MNPTAIKATIGSLALAALLILGFAAKAGGPGPFNAITVSDSLGMQGVISMHTGSSIAYSPGWTEYEWMINLTGDSINKGDYVCYDRTGDTAVAVHHMASAETCVIADSIKTQDGGPAFYVAFRIVNQAASESALVKGLTAYGSTHTDTVVTVGTNSTPGITRVCPTPLRKILSIKNLNVTNHDTTMFTFTQYPSVRQGVATGDTAWAGIALDSSRTRKLIRVCTKGYCLSHVAGIIATYVIPGTPLATCGAGVRGMLAPVTWTLSSLTPRRLVALAVQPTVDSTLKLVKVMGPR